MGEKQDIIKRMLEMQQEFIKIEQGDGIDGAEYYDSDPASFMHKYREEYALLADKLINMAHSEKGSRRD